MATAFPLEDHIHCSICFEIYTNPYILQCLHTFCHNCILQLQKGTSIDCPECREQTVINKIKKDFKTQTFLDWHFKQTVEASMGNKSDLHVKVSSKCELCNNELKPLHSKCINCNQYLCLECVYTHNLISVCKHHTLEPVADIVKSIHAKLKENIKSLEEEKKGVLKTSNEISVRIRDIQQSKLKQLADVKKYKEEIFSEIEEYCDDLNSKIVEVNDELIQNLTESEQHFNKVLKEIQQKIDGLSNITETQDITLVLKKASTINTDVQHEIKDIKKKLPKVNTKAKSPPVEVNKHVEWDVSKTVTVTVDSMVHLSHKFKPKAEGPLFTEMIKHQYKQTRVITLSFNPQRLSQINDELWIAGIGGIHIHNKDCQKIREINDQEIRWATGVVQAHNGDIIVSTYSHYNNYTGLHKIHRHGTYIEKITGEKFSDVAVFKDKIYALEYDLHKIIMYEERNKQWTKVKEIPLTYTNGHWFDKLCANDTGIYVTSYKNSRLYCHNLDGEYMNQTGQKGNKAPGNLNMSSICNVDELGNVLVADNGHHCLQLYSKDNKWQIIDIPVTEPRDAVVDQHASNIWAITSEKTLTKFTKV